jgi:gliding motility-associated-like protein
MLTKKLRFPVSVFLVVSCLLLFTNPLTFFAQGAWTQKASLPAAERTYAVGFSIGTKGYIGTGENTGSYYNDFWEWDQTSNVWTQKANFPGAARSLATGFSIGTKGYLGTGSSSDPTVFSDFWEWDQSTNIWTRKADFGGGTREGAFGFSIGTKGYMGAGYAGFAPITAAQDFWEYDPVADTWTSKAPYAGGAKGYLATFTIGTKGYVGTGSDNINGFHNDFWEWDQGTGNWTAKATFPGPIRRLAVGFSLGNKGYIGTGNDNSGYTNDFWEWDQGMDTWVQKANFGGGVRLGAVGFSIGCKGYIGTGQNGGYTNDFWEWDPVSFSISATQNLLCTGCNGMATANPISGTSPFAYLWSNAQTAQTATSLCAGNYTCIVTDSIGCTSRDTVVITQSDMLTDTVTATTIRCNGGTAIATASASKGKGTYTYSWSNGQTTSVVNGLMAGNYTVTVTDSSGCMIAQTVTITQPLPLTVTVIPTAVSCNGGNNGTAGAIAAGGTVPYTYSWSSGGTATTKNNLTAGTYSVTVTDSNSCTAIQTVIITQPEIVSANISAVSNVSCHGGNNGFAIVSAAGGTLPYIYSWSSGGTAATKNNLSIGTYTITVTDSNSCTASNTVTITQPTVLSASISSTNVSCYGGNNGTAIASVSGGQSPYTYNWLPGGITASYNSHLLSQTYTVTLTDSNNCITTAQAVITQPPSAINLSTTGTTGICSGDSTTIAVSATGGIAPYLYLWTNAPVPSQSSQFVSPVVSTNYKIIVTDSNACKDSASVAIIVHPKPDVLFSFANVCNGDSARFHNLSTIPLTDTIQSYTWNLGDASPISNDQAITYLYAAVGSYPVQLLAVSNFGCRDSISKIIFINPNPVARFKASNTVGCSPLCLSFSDSSSTIQGSSIAQWAWNVGDGTATNHSQNFEYCYTNLSIDSNAYFTVTLKVTSDSGCVSTVSENNYITVYPNPGAVFEAQPQTATITDPLISITDLSKGSSSWNWNFGDNSTSNIFSPSLHTYSDTGTYIITLITSTQHGCSDTAYHTIIIEPDFVFYIPDAFTPNGDGVNDTFTGKGMFFTEYQMRIYDRWGNLIFSTNDINKSWDGTANHGTDIAQRDVYVYVITLFDLNKLKHNYRGIVSLVR